VTNQKARIENATVPLEFLQPHPKNYNRHNMPGVVTRMVGRMRGAAFTAPIIINPDGVILAGHLRRRALLELQAQGEQELPGIGPGWQIPVRIFYGTKKQELAILAGDNTPKFDFDYDVDMLTELLSELAGEDMLDATGYDAEMLDSLIAETVPDQEVDPASEWEGMPEFHQPESRPHRTIIIHMESEEAVQDFQRILGQTITSETKFLFHPKQVKADWESQRYATEATEPECES